MTHALLALLLLGAAEPTPCVATTDIPEFAAGISRTCGPGIKSVSIAGNHARLVYTITYAADLVGRRVARTPMHAGASVAARTSWSIISAFYPMKEFLYVVHDRHDRLVCITKVNANGSGGTYCVDTVGPASPEGTVS